VAKAAGVPSQVVERAAEILEDLERKELEIKEMKRGFSTNLFGEVE
jgi:DNA mismatch repair ATPase MutS